MLNFEGVFNPLSFGYITFGLAKELFKRKVDFNFFPINGSLDWSSFDKVDDGFKNYINTSANDAMKKFSLNDNSFKVWHISQSWHKLSKKSNSLLTFSECDALTDEETNILNSFDKVFVTSKFSKSVFEDYGVKSKIVYAPMGIDNETFYNTAQPRPFKDIIVFGLFSKAEKRKHNIQAAISWIKKFGGNPKYKLHLHITNPFFKPEQQNQIYAQIFSNAAKPFNVDIFPYFPTNSQLNGCYNAVDIVIDVSGGESISLPSLNCVAMGKHGIIHYNSAMKDWATDENAVLIKPNGKMPIYDGVFFQQGSKFNTGNFYTYSEDDLIGAFQLAINRFEANPINEAGKKLQETYSFKVGADIILGEINS